MRRLRKVACAGPDISSFVSQDPEFHECFMLLNETCRVIWVSLEVPNIYLSVCASKNWHHQIVRLNSIHTINKKLYI